MVIDSFAPIEKGPCRCDDPGKWQSSENPELSQESRMLVLLLLLSHPEGVTHLLKGTNSPTVTYLR